MAGQDKGLLITDLNELKASSFDRLTEFFKENSIIKPYFDVITEECKKNKCYSLATRMILTIEKLLDEINN